MLPPDHFDALYAASPDPWEYDRRWYERRRHRLTLCCLPSERYRRAFEPGCSNGALTSLLAPRCGEVVATDMSERAVMLARSRTAHLGNVEVRRLRVPHEWPGGRFDLVVLSELGYYLLPPDLGRFLDRAESCLDPGGHLVAVHWRGDADDFTVPGGAREVHDALLGRPGWARAVSHTEAELLVDVMERLS
ncbi:MAG: class I SAM-dependent methyltransferase [Acidimicrobiales bacterium]